MIYHSVERASLPENMVSATKPARGTVGGLMKNLNVMPPTAVSSRAERRVVGIGRSPIGSVCRRAALSLIFSAFAFPAVGVQTLEQADRIIVLKSERRLLLMRGSDVLTSFWIALGRHPVGQKMRRGDGRTPEGLYRIVGRTKKSIYYRALQLSYPNEADKERARKLGVNPGGDILIHAVPEGFEPNEAGARMIDWTNGCIAVTNADMDEIWDRVANGTWVEIRP
jgi:lipoprotein-anchoring transpeptidase ErfK/SrfK